MFNFTPLLGAKCPSRALQSLLEFDGGIRILVDVGWDVSFNAEQLKDLERQVPTISFVLLTHATLAHIGAYAHCCKHVPLFSRIPVYATTPVVSLGRTLLQDLYASTALAASLIPQSSLTESSYSLPSYKTDNANILLPPPSNEEITKYFSVITPLKYLQPHEPTPSPFSPPLNGLIITPHCAGHTLGGTIWHIQYGSESVVYAVDWNQAREKVFPGAAWLATGAEVVEQLRKPTALVCSSKGATVVTSQGGRQQRDEQLLDTIRTAIKGNGSVLIPCDSSGRVLELAYMLERAWITETSNDKPDSLRSAKLFFASPTAASTMRYARSMLEWMDESIVREFEAASSAAQAGRGQNKVEQPFEFKHLKPIERKSQLERALGNLGPKVILASHNSLDWGYSQSVLQSFAGGEQNVVVLGDGVHPRAAIDEPGLGISNSLWDIVHRRVDRKGGPEEILSAAVVQCEDDEVQIKTSYTSPLSGDELPIYQQYLARQRQRQNTLPMDKSSTLETSADVVDEHSSSTSSSDKDSEDEQQGKALNVSTTISHSKNKIGMTDEELGINVLLRRKNVHDYDVRGKKGRDKMFPHVAKRRRNDDFGDVIRPEEYLRAEEREDEERTDSTSALLKGGNAVGAKRKWNEADLTDPRKRPLTGPSKRRRSGQDFKVNGEQTQATTDQDDDGEEESDESDYEPAEPVVKGPSKANFSIESLKLKLKIAVFDFMGLHDKRSLHMLIPLIHPRKLILTGGDEQETLLLANDCRRLLISDSADRSKEVEDNIMAPSNGSTVDASVDTNAWAVKLSQSLFKHLQWQKFRGLGIVTLNGKLEMASAGGNDDASGKRQKVDSGDGKVEPASNHTTDMPVLSELPIAITGSMRSANQALHVGDLRLAELRKIMQASGHTAEFKGEGTLLVDGLIAVRKSGVGKIEVESGRLGIPNVTTSGASFNNVRRKIYEGLAVVAAT